MSKSGRRSKKIEVNLLLAHLALEMAMRLRAAFS